MKKSYKGLIILMLPFALGFLSGFLVRGCSGGKRASSEVAERVTSPEVADSLVLAAEEGDAEEILAVQDTSDDVDGVGVSQAKEIIYYGRRLKYATLFADMNPAHLEVARARGLKSVPQTRSEVDTLHGLVKVEDSDCYVIDDLKYSMPYLTPAARKELDTIGQAFRDSLASKKLLDYKLVVSSLLRTEEDVKRLRRSGNPNASDNSAHCYGTTFDITYTRYFREDESEAFMQPYELTKVLGEVLRDRKKSDACLVKYERKEHCFHITAK